MEQLYSVQIEKTLLVLAENEDEAKDIARWEGSYDDGEFDAFVKKVESLEDIPKDWRNGLPYEKDSKNLNNLTCENIVKKYDQEKQINNTTIPLFSDSSLTPAVVVAIKNNQGEFLFLHRKSPPNGWCLAGGKVDDGEDPICAAIREVKEETGLDVTDSIERIGDSMAFDGRPVIVHVATTSNTSIILSKKEHSAYLWIKGVPENITLAGKTRNFLEMALEN